MPPPQASLVIFLPDAPHPASLTVQSQMHANLVTMLCSETLAIQPAFTNVKVSATRWTPNGNLVIFGGLDTSPATLLSATHVLTSALSLWLSLLGPSYMMVHTNVKWSKVLVNGIPLHLDPTPGSGVHSSAALHMSLTTYNPFYTALKITQMLS